LNQSVITLNIELSAPVKKNKPFAALRSMFVQDDNSDVSEVKWLSKNNPKSQNISIMSLKSIRTSSLWTGRMLPSKHNTSAPDLVFRDFK
jgi:hypothetical protein